MTKKILLLVVGNIEWNTYPIKYQFFYETLSFHIFFQIETML